jgi:hypothetical protein
MHMSVETQEPAVKQETATFYSWMGYDARERRAYPSSQIIYISGGTKKVIEGQAVREPVVEARFHNGRYTTDNPEIIMELRRIAAIGGSCISEDKEVFYAATMTVAEREKRSVVVGKERAQEVDRLVKENNRLRDQLEKQAKKQTAA